jgi:hypothetical protein
MQGTGRGQRAFTVLEVMIAVVLMTVCLVPVVAFNQRNLIEAGATKEEILARQYLLNLCERFKNENPEYIKRVQDDPSLLDQDFLVLKIREKASESGQGEIAFQRGLNIQLNHEGNNGLHRVTFWVRWKSAARKVDRELRLSRLIHWHLS